MAKSDDEAVDDDEPILKPMEPGSREYISSQLAWITTQVTHLNKTAQRVKDGLQFIWWCVVAALVGYAVGKLFLMVLD